MVKSILSETAEVLLRPAPLLRAIHAFRNLAFNFCTSRLQ